MTTVPVALRGTRPGRVERRSLAVVELRAFEGLRSRVRTLGAVSHPGLWGAILDLADHGRELADADRRSGAITLDGYLALRSDADLEATLTAVLGTPAGEAVGVVRRLVDDLGDDEEGRVALEVLLRRAANAPESLVTYAPAGLFDAQERRALDDLRVDAPSSFPGAAPAAPRPRDESLTVILKLTRLCNLRCTYCHDWSPDAGTTMPLAVRARAFESLIGDRAVRRADVVWHGGEPTVLGRWELLRTLYLERWYAAPGQHVVNHLQTNATRVDDEWARFFARYGMRVGVSLDGPPEVHDRTRRGLGGAPSFDRVREGLAALRRAGAPHGVLVVVTPEIVTLGAARLVETLRGLGVTRVGVLPVRPAAFDAEPYLPLDTWTRFLIELDLAVTGTGLAVRELDALRRAAAGAAPHWCELEGDCVGTVVSVEADGTVAHCDKYVGDPAYALGSVRSATASRLRTDPPAVARSAALATEVAGMAACRWFDRCHGGCPHERYARRRRGEDRVTCCGLAPVLDHLAAASE